MLNQKENEMDEIKSTKDGKSEWTFYKRPIFLTQTNNEGSCTGCVFKNGAECWLERHKNIKIPDCVYDFEINDGKNYHYEFK